MKKRSSALLSLATYALVALGSATVPVITPTEAMANNQCGGLNQRVCKKWEQLRGCDPGFHRTSPIGGTCTRDNKLIPDKIEEKLTQFYEPSKTNCGGNNQRVCKKSEQLRGCDPGFHRTSPIGGICTRDNKFIPDKIEAKGDFKREVKALAGEVASMTLAHQDMLKTIVQCMRAGDRNRRFKRAVEAPDIEAAVGIAFECVTPQKAGMLRTTPMLQGASTRLQTMSSGGGMNTLTIGVGGGGGIGILFGGIGKSGNAGVAFDLTGNAAPRFYSSSAKAAGIGLALNAGADLIVGISNDAVQAGASQGTSVSATLKALFGGGLSVDFDGRTSDDLAFSGIAVSGGVGVGGELGMMTYTSTRIH